MSPPPWTPGRHAVLDGDTPYLVVAADNGTAAFPDLANAEPAEVDFWFGDAFASGGSAGYDHKRLGVTRGEPWSPCAGTSPSWVPMSTTTTVGHGVAACPAGDRRAVFACEELHAPGDRQQRHPGFVVMISCARRWSRKVGPGFLYRLEDRTGSTVTQAVRAFVVVRDAFGLEELWDSVSPLPPRTNR